MAWVNKNEIERDIPSHNSVKTGNGRQQFGVQGNGFDPTNYGAQIGYGWSHSVDRLPNGAYGPEGPIPSGWLYQQISKRNFPGARNSAWGSFASKVHEGSAQLGVALAESHQGLQMVAERAGKCYRAYRDLRKGNFRGFLRELTIGPKRKHRNKIRNAIGESSSLWLEYSFGWKPLFTDIYDGIHAVGRPVPGGKVSGSGSQDITHNELREKFTSVVRCKQGARVYVTNPNTYLLQQTGFANPALIAWELVPFSFVVDWVFDVGTSLGALTDLMGCEVKGAYCTYFCKARVSATTVMSGKNFTRTGNMVCISRKTGLAYPLPNFAFRSNIGSSINRAANAVSLLGQILTK